MQLQEKSRSLSYVYAPRKTQGPREGFGKTYISRGTFAVRRKGGFLYTILVSQAYADEVISRFLIAKQCTMAQGLSFVQLEQAALHIIRLIADTPGLENTRLAITGDLAVTKYLSRQDRRISVRLPFNSPLYLSGL